MSEWQKIATAPKDGTLIIVSSPRWRDSDVARWWPDGIWHYGDHFRASDPTHWQPLPTPPQD